jgi:hypothetical protein
LGTDIRGPEEREAYWQLSTLVEIAEVQDNLDLPYISCVVWSRSRWFYTNVGDESSTNLSGEKGFQFDNNNAGTDTHPSMSPRRNRQMKNVVRPLSLACEAATILCFNQQNLTWKTLATITHLQQII